MSQVDPLQCFLLHKPLFVRHNHKQHIHFTTKTFIRRSNVLAFMLESDPHPGPIIERTLVEPSGTRDL